MENFEISGMLYKRRGGFGKIMPNAWQYRFFAVTKDGMLLYFDTDSPDPSLIVESKARGKMDLRSVQYEFSIDAPQEGAPFSFIMVLAPVNEEKWKLCAATREDQLRWSAVFEKYLMDKLNLPSGGSSGSSIRQQVYYTSDDEQNTKVRSKSELSIGSSSPKTSRSIGESQKSFSSPPPPPPPEQSSPTASTAMAHGVREVPEQSTRARAPSSAATPVSTSTSTSSKKPKAKKSLKLVTKQDFFTQELLEWVSTLLVVNFCIYLTWEASWTRRLVLILIMNIVVGQTLVHRSNRATQAAATAAATATAGTGAGTGSGPQHTQQQQQHHHQQSKESHVPIATGTHPHLHASGHCPAEAAVTVSHETSPSGEVAEVEPSSSIVRAASGKPVAGCTLPQVFTSSRTSPDHTWYVCDHRLFNVRIGPDYNRHKKKAPSGKPLYDPVAVDVFCTKSRIDHAAQRFELPDVSGINTHHPHVPPIWIVQIQIPSEPPPSMFTTVEDGPGWAILIYFRITEETCNELKDLSTASPAVKLFAEYCEKSFVDPLFRGRFKVICSCTNLAEFGMPSMIVQYNAKPVLIRRTGTLFRGDNYIEKDIHVHKFATLAKSSIHMISSKCGLMYMQIGFVIEGREDKELPEVLFGCVGVNKPQEEQAEFIFDEE